MKTAEKTKPELAIDNSFIPHANLPEALAAAQAEIRNPEKTKEAKAGSYSYKYADIGDVLESVLPILSKHGLSVQQPTAIREGQVVLITRLSHISGEHSESEYPVCAVNGNHQAMGAAMTYARRYALTSMIGVAAVDDTDGQGAAMSGEGPRQQMSSYQAKKELNWEKIQADIDSAADFARLTKWREHLATKKGDWPESFISSGLERVQLRELELADERMKAAGSLDELNDAFTDLEAILHGRVHFDDLSGLHSKNEQRFEP